MSENSVKGTPPFQEGWRGFAQGIGVRTFSMLISEVLTTNIAKIQL